MASLRLPPPPLPDTRPEPEQRDSAWLEAASQEEIDAALANGELDDLLRQA